MYAYAVEAFETAEEAYQTVLDTAGCFPRDPVELRLIADTKAGTYTYEGSVAHKKGIIDNAADAEGFFDYPQAEALTDTDLDGMPDEWESANGCNPLVPDNNTLHKSGYTMLEVYLHYAMTGKDVPQGIQYSEVSIQTQKILRDGQILIQRGGRLYTITGLVISD